MDDLVARAQIDVDADRHTVWRTLTDPERIRRWMGATVTSTWVEEAEISWHGEWDGRSFADHGRILQYLPESTLRMSHSGGTDADGVPHTLTFDLSDVGDGGTRVRVTQEHNVDEATVARSEHLWAALLGALKGVAESYRPARSDVRGARTDG